jgi:anti-sigma B factor antagonist
MGDVTDFRVELTPEGAIVYARGAIDLAASPTLRNCLRELTGSVMVDLSDVTFLDSSGMGALVAERRRLIRDGGDLQLRSPQEIVRRALEVTGLAELLVSDE